MEIRQLDKDVFRLTATAPEIDSVYSSLMAAAWVEGHSIVFRRPLLNSVCDIAVAKGSEITVYPDPKAPSP